jgi:hypothetical protein
MTNHHQLTGIKKRKESKIDIAKKADKHSDNMEDERVPGQGSDGNNETRAPEKGGAGSGSGTRGR